MNPQDGTAEFLLEQGIELTPLVRDKKFPKNKRWQEGNGAITKVSELTASGDDYGSLIQWPLLGIDIDVKK